jgi:hypothetical protein
VILKQAERVDLELAAARPMRVKVRRSRFPVTPPNQRASPLSRTRRAFPLSEANRLLTRLGVEGRDRRPVCVLLRVGEGRSAHTQVPAAIAKFRSFRTIQMYGRPSRGGVHCSERRQASTGADLETVGGVLIMSRRTDVADVPAVLYGVEEAAAALRLSRSVLYELIRSG